MVHALYEAHRALKADGLLLDIRPGAEHRRAGLGEGKSWRLVDAMREKLDDDRASDRAVRQVMQAGLFRRESRVEFDLDRVMDTLEDFRSWLDDFSIDTLASHELLYRKVERALAEEPAGTKITVRGPLKIAALRRMTS